MLLTQPNCFYVSFGKLKKISAWKRQQTELCLLYISCRLLLRVSLRTWRWRRTFTGLCGFTSQNGGLFSFMLLQLLSLGSSESINVANNSKSFSRTSSRPASSVVRSGSNIAVTFMQAVGRTMPAFSTSAGPSWKSLRSVSTLRVVT